MEIGSYKTNRFYVHDGLQSGTVNVSWFIVEFLSNNEYLRLLKAAM